MQADAMRVIAGKMKSVNGLDVAVSAIRITSSFDRHRQPFSFFCSPTSRFPAYHKLEGWAMKAPEFIDSGPPVLLNNPRCCRRVVMFFPQTCNGGSLWLKRRKPRSRRL